ncbi:MAG: glucose-1-phosphate adenylyltransferase [Deltaproteobacteria bacterium]|nr:glucose-1-phosphate adenylyltransferase [Deltaproteobacteria bacterium]
MTPYSLPRRGPPPRVLSIVLAGGEGKRLMPLTRERAKPAVPIGGRYRLIDFVLSNLVNSGLMKIKVLTQYKSDSLNTHLARGWRLPQMLDYYVESVPAQQRTGPTWFRGSADALYQALNVVTDEDPDAVCVFSSDHIYKMDVRQMLDYHLESGAAMTVAAVPVPSSEARAFGVLGVDEANRMTAFVEKPELPPEIPGKPGRSWASMGNYIWNTEALIEELKRDASAQSDSQHDFGRNILPALAGRVSVAVYDFTKNEIPGASERERGYWRDVGTVASYYAANMDLAQVHPVLDLYNPRWPIRTWARTFPPAKFVFADVENDRIGLATDSLVCEGCIISGGRIDRSVLSQNVRIHSFSDVKSSILFENVQVGRKARLRRTIVDKDVVIPEGMEIGYNHEKDASRGLTVIEADDLVVVPKGFHLTQ